MARPVRAVQVAWVSDLALKVLSCSQIQRIDNLLSGLGPFGKVRLIKQKGRLRFVEKVESFDFSDELRRPLKVNRLLAGLS